MATTRTCLKRLLCLSPSLYLSLYLSLNIIGNVSSSSYAQEIGPAARPGPAASAARPMQGPPTRPTPTRLSPHDNMAGSGRAAADDSPSAYHFNGKCSLKGSWTESALQNTMSIRSYINQIREDGNCTGLQDRLKNHFEAIENSILQAPPTSASHNLYSEMGALRNYLGGLGRGDSTAPVLGRIFQNLVRGSVDKAQVIASDVTTAAGKTVPLVSELESLRERGRTTFDQGVRLLNGSISELPRVKECLHDPLKFSSYFSATVQLVGTFLSSGNDPSGSAMAQTISSIAEYMRDAKFAEAMKTLNSNEFNSALSCVLEVATEQYCSTRDAQILFDEMLEQQTLTTRVDAQGNEQLVVQRPGLRMRNGKGESHPLAGYFILAQNIPIITEWLQKIQLGVDPRLPTDAQQKNNALNDNNTFYTSRNAIVGIFNQQLDTLRKYKSTTDKENVIIDMVTDIYTAMNHRNGQNFYTITNQPIDIPFKVLGMPTPDAVRGGTKEFPVPMDPIRYLMSFKTTLPGMAEPEQLALKIQTNLNGLLRDAEAASITYYGQWFLVDKVSILDRAIIGMIYSPVDSLKEIREYLEGLEQKILTYSPDRSMIPGLRDTLRRVNIVLMKFEELDAVGARMSSEQQAITSEQHVKLVEDLINVVFNEFMVMLAKSGWLANRMAAYVEYDLNLTQRYMIDITPYQSDIYVYVGRAMSDLMVEISGKNPTLLQQDLSVAQRINKNNILALEQGLGSSYARMISTLLHSIQGRKFISDQSVSSQVLAKRPPPFENIPGRDYLTASYNFVKTYFAQGMTPLPLSTAYDRIADYTRGASIVGPGRQRLAPEDEFSGAKLNRDQFCIQTLAFLDLEPYWGLCRDVSLPSPFVKSQGYKELSDVMKKRLQLNYVEKAWENLPGHEQTDEERSLSMSQKEALNHSNRICALRDFSRQNFVLYLLQGQTRQ